jgi:hypothetical protein
MPSQCAVRSMTVQKRPAGHIVVRRFEHISSMDCVQLFLFLKNNILNIL